MSHRPFGYVRGLPSGRFQASYLGPDRHRHTGPQTFDTRGRASAWLATVSADIQRGMWVSPAAQPKRIPTFGSYAAAWLDTRDLAGSTRNLYQITLRNQILPTFGDTLVTDITPAGVRAWFAGMNGKTPRQRAAAYGLLRTVLNTAVADDVIESNPCRVRGATGSKRQKPIEPASIAEVQSIADHMPPRYRALVLVAAWCRLRFGELAALTRADIDLDAGKVRVRRAVSREARGFVIKAPKTEAGRRTVAVPPHIIPVLRDRLRRHVAAHPGALLFPAELDRTQPIRHSTVRWHYERAVEAAGRPGMTFHALRHTGTTLAAATGATLAELMARLGQSTAQSAMAYQHAAEDRDTVIATALSRLAEAEVIPMRGHQQTG